MKRYRNEAIILRMQIVCAAHIAWNQYVKKCQQFLVEHCIIVDISLHALVSVC